MIGASKILTVSYGTFSCTLEGFEEPFNTMKAIAEYFRDLAAEDRYFGAEPPTPDAAMLHRIAEREIQRRVEAKIEDNSVHLRAASLESGVFGPAPLPPGAGAGPVLGEAAPAALSVAAKLSRLRAAQGLQPLSDFVPFAPVPPVYVEDEEAVIVAPPASRAAPPAPEPIQPQPTAAPASLPEPPAPESPAVPDEALPEAPVAPDADAAMLAVLAQLPAQDAVAEAAPKPAPEMGRNDTIASAVRHAKSMARQQPPAVDPRPSASDDTLLAVMSALTKPEAEAPQEPEEIAAAEAPAPFEAAEIAPTETPIAATEPSVEAKPEPEAAAEPEAAVALPEPVAEMATAASAEIAAEAPPAPPANAERLQRARARVIKVRRAEAPQPAPAQDAPTEAAPESPEPAPVAEVAPVVIVPQRPVSRAAQAAASSLSEEAERALQAELAALEAELDFSPALPAEPEAAALPDVPEMADVAEADDFLPPEPAPMADETAEAAPAADAEPAEQSADAAHEIAVTESRRTLETEAADMNRLIAQTNSAMDGPATRRRQSAIAHLKAAVAATVADRRILGSSADRRQDNRADPYREDLERAVRPPRPTAVPDEPARAASAAPEAAPPSNRLGLLVLVSEQRIDRPAPAKPASAPAASPVRPRRVSAQGSALALQSDMAAPEDEPVAALDADAADSVNVFAEAQPFPAFAERLGAQDLAELMEAAAVYTAHLQAQPRFNRRDLMAQVNEVPDLGKITREDSLRVFGSLLRQGRIMQVDTGIYEVTERSIYLAEYRKISG